MGAAGVGVGPPSGGLGELDRVGGQVHYCDLEGAWAPGARTRNRRIQSPQRDLKPSFQGVRQGLNLVQPDGNTLPRLPGEIPGQGQKQDATVPELSQMWGAAPGALRAPHVSRV